MAYVPYHDLTKAQLVALHREMWDWLAKNPGKEKEEWPGWAEGEISIKNIYAACFACQFDEDVRGEKGLLCGQINCSNYVGCLNCPGQSRCQCCPLDLNCLHGDSSKSVFHKWLHAGFDLNDAMERLAIERSTKTIAEIEADINKLKAEITKYAEQVRDAALQPWAQEMIDKEASDAA